jgi:ketosteroid isomerase-like protein
MTADFARIEELHQADMRASKERDYRTLCSIMSDDAVVLPPGGRMIRGRDALDKSFASMAGTVVNTDILEYCFDWHEIEICGGFAFEWGYVIGKERVRATGDITSETYQVMRILQRQSDGGWKVHRTIWNQPAKQGFSRSRDGDV